ncbi:hypothetical protein FRC12_020567 [Ceratobasidium sp. 428]|nr:hypothetical protein FRC12_020567 [Ceratobasidium sp. 428]
MHAGLRDIYEATSKRKSTVDKEVLRKHHAAVVYDYMQLNIDAHDAAASAESDSNEDLSNTSTVYHVRLCARSNQLILPLIEEQQHNDPAFYQLELRAHKLIKEIDPTFPLDHPFKVYECHMLKVQFESFEDWRLHRDILRCNPHVHSKERRDCVIVQSDRGVTLARLLMLILCMNPITKSDLSLALVVYFDPVYGPVPPLERALGFKRFRQHPRKSAEIIPAKSIIRGALLVSSLEELESREEDFFANDLVDSDMYLRFRHYSKNKMFR